MTAELQAALDALQKKTAAADDSAFRPNDFRFDDFWAGSSSFREVYTASTIFHSVDGWVHESDGWYYYREDVRLHDWLKEKNTWYYLDLDTGRMYDNGLAAIDGETYYFFAWGGMANSFWLHADNGDWYFFGGNGAMKRSTWVEWKGEYYYVGADGVMLTSTTTPDGYRVDANGAWIR
jgi:glucan-binding YG repeat protein